MRPCIARTVGRVCENWLPGGPLLLMLACSPGEPPFAGLSSYARSDRQSALRRQAFFCSFNQRAQWVRLAATIVWIPGVGILSMQRPGAVKSLDKRGDTYVIQTPPRNGSR